MDTDWHIHSAVVVCSRSFSGVYEGRDAKSSGVHIHFQQPDICQRGKQRETKSNTFGPGKYLLCLVVVVVFVPLQKRIERRLPPGLFTSHLIFRFKHFFTVQDSLVREKIVI